MDREKVKIVFFGTPEFAGNTLRKLVDADFFDVAGVVTVPDKPVGRKQELTPPPVKIVALELGIPVWQPENLKSSESPPTSGDSDGALLEGGPHRDCLQEWDADLFVVIAYGKIIPRDILDIPKFGAMNIHYSLLPKYRGAAPVQYALLNGDKETGVTIMLLDEKMDHGPIIGNWKLEIGNLDTSETLFEKLATAGDKLLLEIIPKYVAGEIEPQEQDHKKATYTKMIQKEDGLVDWDSSAVEIYNKWRAFQPWPGTHTKIRKYENTKTLKLEDGKVIKLLDIRVFGEEIEDRNNVVGEFCVEDGKLLVRCGCETCLEILKLQVEGKKAMGAEAFMNGYMK